MNVMLHIEFRKESESSNIQVILDITDILGIWEFAVTIHPHHCHRRSKNITGVEVVGDQNGSDHSESECTAQYFNNNNTWR